MMAQNDESKPNKNKKSPLKCTPDRKGDSQHRRSSSHKGGDLNMWDLNDMSRAWQDYKE